MYLKVLKTNLQLLISLELVMAIWYTDKTSDKENISMRESPHTNVRVIIVEDRYSMKMKEFVEIVKESKIAGDNQVDIVYKLLDALGAKPAISEVTMYASDKSSYKSPVKSTVQKWLSSSCKPRVVSYFPNLKIENGERAHELLRSTPQKNQWIELKNLFKAWHDNGQNSDKTFYINTETDDFNTFSTSFWRQFVSFFDSLKMWDGADELYQKSSIEDEMRNVIKEKYMQYRVYEFVPKELKNVIDSLHIYHDIWNENAKLKMHESSVSTCDAVQKSKKMYCKWFSDYDNFLFYEVAKSNGFWKLQTSGECVLIKFPENFDYDMIPPNTWMTGSVKYTVVGSVPENEQLNEEELSWKECLCDIIIIDISSKKEKSVNEGIFAKARLLVDEKTSVTEGITIKATAVVKKNAPAKEGVSVCKDISTIEEPLIEDCYVFIDGMLALNSSIEEFMEVINEEVIMKYKGQTFDDGTRQLYNGIMQYRKSLKKFKKYLIKFRNLKKEKSQYFSDLALMEAFGDYLLFSDFDASPKPCAPFSECYLSPEEARKVVSGLYRHHQSLIETYVEIINQKEAYMV